VSVVLPSRERPALLARAIESVLNQTFGEFELIITLDEPEDAASWGVARRFAAADARVRLTRNPGAPGVIANLNHGMSLATGEWIKPLYDDDVLGPTCLERMLAAADAASGAALVNCLAARETATGRLTRERLGSRSACEWISRDDAHLAMYLQDVDLGTPTRVMARWDAVAGGAVLLDNEGSDALADVAWYARVLEHGDLVLVNDHLAHCGPGAGALGGKGRDLDELHAEFRAMRRRQRGRIEDRHGLPSLAVAEQVLWLIKAASEARVFGWRAAWNSLSEVRSPLALALFARWLLRRTWPGAFEATPRRPITPAETVRSAGRVRSAAGSQSPDRPGLAA
jgi:glycosyltransferase involved in cell wall biosynthesis